MDTFELSLRSVTEDDAAAPAAAAFLSFIVGPYWWLGLLLVHPGLTKIIVLFLFIHEHFPSANVTQIIFTVHQDGFMIGQKPPRRLSTNEFLKTQN